MWHPKEDARFFYHTHPGFRKALKRTARFVLGPILCPILFPCYCYYLMGAMVPTCGNGKMSARHAKRARRTAIVGQIAQCRRERGLQNRKRELSVERKRNKRTKDQDQSPLFAKLPTELRLKIYEMVLCETGSVHVFHSTRGHDPLGLASLVSIEEDECSDQPLCFGPRPTLNLLKTCRKMYFLRIHYSVLKGADNNQIP